MLYLYDYVRYTRRGDVPPREAIKPFQTITLRICVPLLCVSSSAILGAILMARSYMDQIGSTGGSSDVIRLAYSEAFNVFFTLEFAIPDWGWLSVDFDKIAELVRILQEGFDFDNISPSLLLDGSSALTAVLYSSPLILLPESSPCFSSPPLIGCRPASHLPALPPLGRSTSSCHS